MRLPQISQRGTLVIQHVKMDTKSNHLWPLIKTLRPLYTVCYWHPVINLKFERFVKSEEFLFKNYDQDLFRGGNFIETYVCAKNFLSADTYIDRFSMIPGCQIGCCMSLAFSQL